MSRYRSPLFLTNSSICRTTSRTSDLNEYEHYIRAYFDDYGIPFFFDQKKLLNQHPLVRMLCSALQVVTGGFSNTDIFSYLKSDLAPIGREEADNLENYCLAFA